MKSPEETDHPRIFVKLNLGGRFGPLQVVPVKPWPNPKLSARLDAWNLGTVDALSYVEASGWAGGANASGQVAVGVVAGGSASHSTSDSWLSLALDDIDGDGAVDHVLRTKGMAEVRARLNKGGKANLLRRVVRPLGGSFTLDYRREGNRVDADGARAVDMPANQWALASVTVDDGQGSQPLKTELEYGAAAGHGAFYDRTRRESYGFSHVLTRRSDGSTVEAVFRNQRPYDRGLLEESTEKDEAGFLVRKVVNTYEDRPVGPDSIFVALRERTTTFFEGDRGPLAASAPSHKERWDYDGSGNVTLYADEGERGDPSDDLTHVIKYEQQELVASGHLHRPTFIESTGNGEVLRRRTAHYRADGSPDLVTDLLAKGKQPATGAAYTGVDATNPKWTFAYDAFGNVTSVTDPKGYELTYGYDPQTQTFRTSVTESSPGFGYVSRVDHDPRFGLPSVITDVNGHKQRIEYDDFGRPREVWGPSDVQGVAGAPTVAFEYQPARLLPEKTADGRDLYSPALAVTHHKDVARDPFADDRQKWDPIDTVTFVDGLGRLIQTKKDHELDQGAGRPPLVGTTVSGRVTFDHRGRVHTQAQPFFSAEPPTTYLRVGAAEARHATTFKYDSLSRVRQVLTPDGGVTQTSYQLGLFDGRTRLLTLVQDPVQARDAQATTNVAQHRQRATFRTVRDEIVAVQEKNRIRGTLTTLTTRYAYNPVSELERVTDAKGNVTRSEYDTLGHMIALASPDMGRTEWRYDLAGNVAAKETENLRKQGKLIRYVYNFNRLEKIDYPDSPDVTFGYGEPGDQGDGKGNRAGRRAFEVSEAGRKEWKYDRLGNVTTELTSFVDQREPQRGPYVNETGYRFDNLGRMLEMTFPGSGREVVRYAYDRGGNVVAIKGTNTQPNPSHPREPEVTEYLRHVGYDEFGQRTRIVFGNGIETTYAYDPVMRRLDRVHADHHDRFHRERGLGPRAMQRLEYEYDLVGNVESLGNQVPPVEWEDDVPRAGPALQSFRYDDLYQLTGTDALYQNRPAARYRHSLAFAYDEIGNIARKEQKNFRDVLDGGSWRMDHPVRETSYTFDYKYEGPRPHAPSRIDETSSNGVQTVRELAYDGNGNQSGWLYQRSDRREIVWNEEDRIRTIKENGAERSRALYDGSGTRTHNWTEQGETIYVNQHLTIRNGDLPTKHVYAGETRIASKIDPDWFEAPPVLWYHPDHLQSTHFVTDAEQDVVQHDEYFATGEVWVEQTDARVDLRREFLFNGKELDASTGLYHYGARYYDPRLSLWASPDPILASYMRGEGNDGVFLPQNLGLYSYAYNNPAVLRDPDGQIVWLAVAAGVAYGILKSSGTPARPRGGGEVGVRPTSTREFVKNVAAGTRMALRAVDAANEFMSRSDEPSIMSTPRSASGPNMTPISGPTSSLGAADPSTGGPVGTGGAPKLLGPVTRFASKIEGQLTKRGWSKESVERLIGNPSRTAATRDTRFLPGGGRMNDPATAFINQKGHYVVRNDVTGDVVQVSNKFDINWVSPF